MVFVQDEADWKAKAGKGQDKAELAGWLRKGIVLDQAVLSKEIIKLAGKRRHGAEGMRNNRGCLLLPLRGQKLKESNSGWISGSPPLIMTHWHPALPLSPTSSRSEPYELSSSTSSASLS
ncbi:hypothetical protein BY996DRAFT_6469455 [Phakopsora pachyrhizi]|nr:hypothetical protein BY996DRAFT_6469455 [Phakopsora pachyrhizi]